jgi:uncharacterized membrane protein YfcA
VLLQFFILFAVAFVANAFSAFAGGGAGLLQLPALLFLGLPFGIALATHKVATVALGVGALSRNLREGFLILKLSLVTIAFGVPGVIVGALFILEVPENIARFCLGVLTIALGVYSYFKPQLGMVHSPIELNRRTVFLGGFVFFLIGILNGSLASGSGLFVTIWYIVFFGLDYKRAVAHTLSWVGIVWNGTGALTLGALGQIQWDWVPPLLIGSFCGGYVGAHFAVLKGSAWVKRAFEFLTISVGIKLLSSL